MGQSSGLSLFRQVADICLSISSLEHLMPSAGDPWSSGIALVGTRWRVGDNDVETQFISPWHQQQQI